MTLHVLLCDDNQSRLPVWAASVTKGLPDSEVQAIGGTQLSDLVSALGWEEHRVRGGDHRSTELDRAALDLAHWADIVILDADLSPAPTDLDGIPAENREQVANVLRNGNGDEVARQLRSYTTAGLIVVVNMFWARHRNPRVFDLTLMQAANTFGDIQIGKADLDDPNFWADAAPLSEHPYRPWQRPSLAESLSLVTSSAEAIPDLDARVLEALGLEWSNLAPGQLDVFGEDKPEEVTFRGIADSPMGFLYESELRDDAAYQRMAASVVRRWLERVLVPGQNVLLDSPHLHERFPRLTGIGDIDSLNSTVQFTWDSAKSEPAGPALFEAVQPFLARPVFELGIAKTEAAKTAAASNASADISFAEDTSDFGPIADLESFVSDVHGSYPRRWIRNLDAVAYEPYNRLLL